MSVPPAPQVAGMPQMAEQSPPSSPERRSGIFSLARSGASTALRVAQLALEDPVEAASVNGKDGKPKNLWTSLLEQLKEGTLAKDASTLVQAAASATEALDDRKMLLENIIELLSTLPPDSPVGPTLQNTFIRLLWRDLPKPPTSFVGEAKFRSANGSGNSLFMPQLGAAGQPYARNVAPVHPMPENLPDVGTVFDALLKRDEFTPHPSGISSLLFAFATLITHSCFQTNREDASINDASSYLDLAPVYGNNMEQQSKIRTGYQGEIHPDAVASQRLFLMPPATVALAIVFSRNHNYITRKLVEVNQNGMFKPWDQLDEEGRKKQDHALFNMARNINCGWFQNVIFQDYIRCILHVNSTMSTWSLVPTGEIKDVLEGALPRGTGNAVSVEFNVLYRWHMAISEKDEQWIEGLMKRFCQKPFADMTPEDFRTVYEGLAAEMGDDPLKWTFGGIKRTGKDGAGPFADKDLVELITQATDTVAGAFKARGVPEVMRVIDCLGMMVARTEWNCASLNEFRRFLNLTEYKSFSEWNPDPVIAETARRLYKNIDNLELFPGLMAEQAKPSRAGSGLCPGYTISRAILSDAAALVRGDRYLTTDYNAGNLTSAQWKDLQPELNNGAFGGSLGKLLLRHFPQHYTFNSTYALFPFTTAHTTGEILRSLQIGDRYDRRRPVSTPDWAFVRSHQGAETVMKDSQRFSEIYGPHSSAPDATYEPSFMKYLKQMGDPNKRHNVVGIIDKAAFDAHWAEMLLTRIGDRTKNTIEEQAWQFDNDESGMLRLDLVRDLVVPLFMNHLADVLGLPMKTQEHPHGIFTPQTLYEMLSDCYTFAWLNFDPTVGYALRDKCVKHSDVLRSCISFRLSQVNSTPLGLHQIAAKVGEVLAGKGGKKFVLSQRSLDMYNRVLESTQRPLEEVSGSLLVGMVNYVTVVASAVNVLDCLLKPQNRGHFDNLCKMVRQNVGISHDAKILAYVNEAMRLQPAIAGTARRAKVRSDFEDGKDKKVYVSEGQYVWIDLNAANRDPAVFIKPDEIMLDRNVQRYELINSVQGLTSTRGESWSAHGITAMLRELLQYPQLARAKGKAGELGRTTGAMGLAAYQRDNAPPSSFPDSMEVTFRPVPKKTA
ncbi:hypothetical protein JCM8097_004294 [Rhodosporidiobolus ruineniae]